MVIRALPLIFINEKHICLKKSKISACDNKTQLYYLVLFLGYKNPCQLPMIMRMWRVAHLIIPFGHLGWDRYIRCIELASIDRTQEDSPVWVKDERTEIYKCMTDVLKQHRWHDLGNFHSKYHVRV